MVADRPTPAFRWRFNPAGIDDHPGRATIRPHSAIDGRERGEIVNLTDRRARASRRAQRDLLDRGPDPIVNTIDQLEQASAPPSPAPRQPTLPPLVMPAHHDVRRRDVRLRRLHGTLAATADRGPKDFPELLLTPGVGTRTVAALALASEVIYGAPTASPIRRATRWRTAAARTGIRIRCR